MEDNIANMKYWFVAYNALEPFLMVPHGIDAVPIKLEVRKIGSF